MKRQAHSRGNIGTYKLHIISYVIVYKSIWPRFSQEHVSCDIMWHRAKPLSSRQTASNHLATSSHLSILCILSHGKIFLSCNDNLWRNCGKPKNKPQSVGDADISWSYRSYRSQLWRHRCGKPRSPVGGLKRRDRCFRVDLSPAAPWTLVHKCTIPILAS